MLKRIASTRSLDCSIWELLPKYTIEYIFVDDGFTDRSLSLLQEAQRNIPGITIVKLSKNVGSMMAIQAGLSFARGDCVGMVTQDLQDPPELFMEMLESWKAGKKVVMAVRSDREESWSQRVFAQCFYALLDRYALRGYPRGGFDMFVIDKQVVNELVLIKEKNSHLMNLIYWLGYERTTVPYVRQKRLHGKSGWTFWKKVKLFVDAFVAFSYVPLRTISFWLLRE